jgi:hypothetical protein
MNVTKPIIAAGVLWAVVSAYSVPAFSRDASSSAAGETSATQIQAASSPGPLAPSVTAQLAHADFRGETNSEETRTVSDWIVTFGDNGGLPFIIVDKVMAKAFVFDSAGRLLGAAPVLLGKARGDDTVPGIGSRKLSAILPEERTTPAGRFVASLGRDLKQDILWIDYKDSISLHRVIRGDPNDHRLERLATVSPLDNRISYGCINVPVKFYEQVVLKTFTGTSGIVYILPEVKTIRDTFPTFVDAADGAGNDARQIGKGGPSARASF